MLESGFCEALSGRVYFPEFSSQVLSQIVNYLEHTGSRAVPDRVVGELFTPELETAMELMMAADFLDLPELCECCASLIAVNLDALPSFGDLPASFISKV